MLFDFSVFLSASVPTLAQSNKYLKVEDAQMQIEDAVVALARSIFYRRGRIIMGGHPSITPLLAMVASEFYFEGNDSNVKPEKQKPIQLYQSLAFEKSFPQETFLLEKANYAELKLTPAVGGEVYRPEEKGAQCPDSLALMRRTMIEAEQPDAMICIGGMAGVELEFHLFQQIRPGKLIYLLKDTGGATSLLSEVTKENGYVRIVDMEGEMSIKPDVKNTEQSAPFKILPYTFYAARIVEEILRGKEQRQNRDA